MKSIHSAEPPKGIARQDWRRVTNAFLKKFLPAPDALRDAVDFHPLRLERRLDSKKDGASKLLFRTRSGHPLETVILRIASGRTSLCVSAQSGCAAACTFCASGRMGLGRNLDAAEILDQVVHAGQILRGEARAVRNIVFMGMGEPFHNEAALAEALGRLSAADGFHIDARRVIVSTVGIPDAMVRFAKAFPRTGLALSLHSARQAVRETIIPVAKRHPLTQLRAALEEIDREVMIEYLMLSDVNDGDEDLEALASWLDGLKVHVNLIPYNPVEGVDLRGAKPDRFSKELKRRGFKVTTRYSLGADIAAACGQLARAER